MIRSVALYGLKFLIVLATGFTFWCVGLILFTRMIPSAPFEAIRTTDGIAVFTGGKTRLNVAIELFQQGKARYLLISGVNPDATFPEVVDQMVDTSRVTLGYKALDTVGNAQETAAWALTHNIKTLRLITSNYHMPRSLFELRHLLPGVEIVPYPVVGKSFLKAKWWLDPHALRLVIQEYNKFLFALIRRPFKDLQGTLQG